MQGFLNAMVYGWTREDFVKSVTNSDDPNVRNKPRAVSFQTDQTNRDEFDSNNSIPHQAHFSHHSEHSRRFNNGGMTLSGSTNGHNQVLSQETDFEDTDLEDDEIQISRTISVYKV